MWHAAILCLILSPVEMELPTHAPPAAWKALKEVALAIEIVGPHEGWGADFSYELNYVRRYYHELRFAPPHRGRLLAAVVEYGLRSTSLQ